MRRADREVRRPMEARAKAAKRRIERGDTQPRPPPAMREDSMASMESMPSADYASGLTAGEASSGGNMMRDMPLEGKMSIDPAAAEEDIAQRITEETGAGGRRPARAQRDQGGRDGAGDDRGYGRRGDMNLRAERKVDQMGNEMFED